MRTHQTAQPRLQLNPDAFRATMHAQGWPSVTAAAAAIGVSHTTLHRALAGDCSPGERLIAALLRVTGEPFETLITTTT